MAGSDTGTTAARAFRLTSQAAPFYRGAIVPDEIAVTGFAPPAPVAHTAPPMVSRVTLTTSSAPLLHYLACELLERNDMLRQWSRRTDIRHRMLEWSPDVASAYEQWIYPVIASLPKAIPPEGADPEAFAEQTQQLTTALRTGTGYRNLVGHLCRIPWYGFGVLELAGTNGIGNPALGEALVPQAVRIPHEAVKFDADGNARILTDDHLVGGEPITGEANRWRFIQATWGSPEGINPYGNGIAERVYWLWHFLTFGRKHWLTALEKFGMPTLLAFITAGDWEQQRERWLEIMQDYVSQAGIAVPKDTVDELRLLNEGQRGFPAHEKLDEVMRQGIAKAILGQTLTTEQGDVGSLALGKVHADMLTDRQWMLVGWVQDVLSETLIRYLSEYLFGGYLGHRLEIALDDPTDADLALKRIQAAKDAGLRVMRAEIHAATGFTEPPPDAAEDAVIDFGAQKLAEQEAQFARAEASGFGGPPGRPKPSGPAEEFAEPGSSRLRTEKRRAGEVDALGAAGAFAAAEQVMRGLAERVASRARKRSE